VKRMLTVDLPPVEVSRETAGRLDGFLELLLRWNSRINLVSGKDLGTLRERHLADSLQLLPLVPAGKGALVDLGSGGGFPGMVLAAALERPVHLVESDRRKAAFLQAAAAELGLSHVAVHPVRIEALRLPPAAVVTARALAPLAVLLPWAATLLAPEGVALFPKGRAAAEELAAAEAAGWTMSVEQFKSKTDPNAILFRMSGIRRAGA